MPSEHELRKLFASQNEGGSSTKTDPLTLLLYQQLFLRGRAAEWIQANGKKVDGATIQQLIEGLVPGEPLLPEALRKWQKTRTHKGRANAFEDMPAKLFEVKEHYERERRRWLQRRNYELWKKFQVLPLEPDSLEENSTAVWYTLKDTIPNWVLEVYVSGDELSNDIEHIRTFSMQPAQSVDRSLRSAGRWEFNEGSPPRFFDPRSEFIIEYREENAEPEELRKAVMELNPRHADVWRLITADSLENWPEGQNLPDPVWVDVVQLLEAMGYKKAVRGGYKPEHRIEAAQALRNISNLRIVVPVGSQILPMDPKTGKRRRTQVTAQNVHKVINVLAHGEIRDMFGNSYPMRWKILPGEWIKDYSRQFAPLYRSIIQLPAKAGTPSWAKAIGTELSYQYRQDRNKKPTKTLIVKTLLERAVLLEEAKDMQNKMRVREYFEKALDLLKEISVCGNWEYVSADINAVDSDNRLWFSKWLECRVNITAPEAILAALPKGPHPQV